jgi:hypothetical protein
MKDGNPFRKTTDSPEQADAPYSVQCGRCGRRIGVTAGIAGTEIICQCGHSVPIPLLSDLRRQSGKGGYGEDAKTVIGRLLSGNESLPGNYCVGCHKSTAEKIVCLAEYDVSDSGRLNPLQSAINYIKARIGRLRGKEPPAPRRGAAIRLPVTLCNECLAANKELRHAWALRTLLKRVPAYKQLLDEYPRAKLSLSEEK